MRTLVFAILIFLGAASASLSLAVDETKPVEGTLRLGEQSIALKYVVAYETKPDDETLIAVVASDRKISVDAIKAALAEGEGNDESLSLRQPHLKFLLQKSGEVVQCVGSANGTFFSTGSQIGEFAIKDGRAQGHAELMGQGEGALKRSFDIRFNVPIGLTAQPQPVAKRTGPVIAQVTGSFRGNGKNAKLAYVTARKGEPFNDQPSIVLVFTEKDHTKDKRADFKAAFGDYGSALIISLHEDGSIFGCEVSHAALGNKTFSSLGNINTESFDVSDGQVEGHIKTNGVVETFGNTWEADIKFTAPFAGLAAKPQSTPVTSAPPAGSSPASGAPDASTAGKINIHDFPFPKDAVQIEYKSLVEQLEFKSPTTGVKALATALVKQLAAQGWKSDGADLINAQSTILTRTRGEASLTIFVKPDGKGSVVRVMSEGLDWTEKKP